MERLTIEGEFITLAQFLKRMDLINSGGQAKPFLQEFKVWVNGTLENRRGRKLVAGDEIRIADVGVYRVE